MLLLFRHSCNPVRRHDNKSIVFSDNDDFEKVLAKSLE